jgi:hypothetical protein
MLTKKTDADGVETWESEWIGAWTETGDTREYAELRLQHEFAGQAHKAWLLANELMGLHTAPVGEGVNQIYEDDHHELVQMRLKELRSLVWDLAANGPLTLLAPASDHKPMVDGDEVDASPQGLRDFAEKRHHAEWERHMERWRDRHAVTEQKRDEPSLLGTLLRWLKDDRPGPVGGDDRVELTHATARTAACMGVDRLPGHDDLQAAFGAGGVAAVEDHPLAGRFRAAVARLYDIHVGAVDIAGAEMGAAPAPAARRTKADRVASAVRARTVAKVPRRAGKEG